MANADETLAQQEHIFEFVQLLESHCEQARWKTQDRDTLQRDEMIASWLTGSSSTSGPALAATVVCSMDQKNILRPCMKIDEEARGIRLAQFRENRVLASLQR